MDQTTSYLILFASLLYLKIVDNKDFIKLFVSTIILYVIYQLFQKNEGLIDPTDPTDPTMSCLSSPCLNDSYCYPGLGSSPVPYCTLQENGLYASRCQGTYQNAEFCGQAGTDPTCPPGYSIAGGSPPICEINNEIRCKLPAEYSDLNTNIYKSGQNLENDLVGGVGATFITYDPVNIIAKNKSLNCNDYVPASPGEWLLTNGPEFLSNDTKSSPPNFQICSSPDGIANATDGSVICANGGINVITTVVFILVCLVIAIIAIIAIKRLIRFLAKKKGGTAPPAAGKDDWWAPGGDVELARNRLEAQIGAPIIR
jgi:hypothetical protein